MKREQSPEEHWAQIAEELGEPILAFALGRIVTAEEVNRRGILTSQPSWALVWLTDAALYIETGSTPNWFQRLITSRASNDEAERRRIPIDTMTKVSIPAPKTGIYKFLSAPEVLVQISHTGTDDTLLIYLDRRGDNDRKLMELLGRIRPE